MEWGIGPSLGLLTIIGDALFVAGAALFWRNRDDISAWVQDEVGAFRREMSRHTVIGPFYCPREESRLKAIPSFFTRSLSRMPAKRIYSGPFLVLIGPILFLLDFFI